MIWGPRLLSPGWLFRVVPLHLAQNKGSDKVWTLCYWFMVRSVYHVMSTMLKFLDPRSYGPILTAKEVGRHSLPVCLWWGMGLESKEPDSALLLGTRYWGLAARWNGWHIIAHSPRLPRFRYVQFIWGTGILTPREGQILAVNLLLLVSVFSSSSAIWPSLGILTSHFLFTATATRTCLFPILEAELWVSLPSASTDTKKTHKTSSWKEDFISRLWFLFEISVLSLEGILSQDHQEGSLLKVLNPY